MVSWNFHIANKNTMQIMVSDLSMKRNRKKKPCKNMMTIRVSKHLNLLSMGVLSCFIFLSAIFYSNSLL